MTTATETPRPAKRRRPWLPVAIVVGVLVVLVGLFFLADTIVRGIAEQRVASEIEQSLPENVDADVAVSIGGASVIAQYLSGTFDRVELSAPDASVDGVPLDIDITADAVPVDTSKTVGNVVATITIDQAGAQSLATSAGLTGTLTLGEDEIEYASEVSALGITVPYDFAVAPSTTPDSVVLTPTAVNVDGGFLGVIDLKAFVTGILQGDPPSICIAQYLPEGTRLDGVTVTSTGATAELSSTSLRLSADSLQTLGSCG
ncbi:DUF2993 domain-containing protein [Plantibacter flavus]|uniref:LmeA family phospholipid-binding protein n=1 Tax=Plantibacter flavus TaxID=150123 RepID=UPI003F16028E